MKISTSIRGKLLLLALLPVTVAGLVSYLSLTRTIDQSVADQHRNTLETASAVASEYLAGRRDFFATQLAGLASSADLPDRLDSPELLLTIDAEAAVLFHADGRVVAAAGTAAESYLGALMALTTAASVMPQHQAIVIRDDVHELHLVPVPGMARDSWLGVGNRVDRELVSRVERLTGLDVALVGNVDGERRLIESSRALRKPGLDLTAVETGGQTLAAIENGNERYLAAAVPLDRGDDSGLTLVLLSSLDAGLAALDDVARNLLLTCLLVAAAAAIFALQLTGTVTAPLRRLAAASRSVMSGSYDTQASGAASGEFDDVARSFDAMRKAVAERESRLSWQALHDPLTNLPNHRHIVAKLAQAIDRAGSCDEPVAVLSIGITRVDDLRSTLGFAAGDDLVMLAACQLQANVESGTVLGQAGPAEFVLLLPGLDVDGARACVDRLRAILANGVGLDRITVSLKGEFGVAVFPEHGSRASELVRRASMARSEAHAASLPMAVFDIDSEARHERQLRIVGDLKSAVDADQINVWYQPRIALAHGNVAGVEALVRWDHPDYGLLQPAEFIDAAEQSGTISHLTRYVLATAVAQCAEWREAGHRLNVSVNLGRGDLADDYLPQFVLQTLREHDVEAHQLTLEVTENAVLARPASAVALLESLRDLGVRLSVDDFGTGPSSLGQIRQLPIHQIKIDREFITSLPENARDELIVRSNIELARGLEIEVVAEGVESEAAARLLTEAGCDHAQGFFYCKPMQVDDCLAWLQGYVAKPLAERRGANRPFSARLDSTSNADDDPSLARSDLSA